MNRGAIKTLASGWAGDPQQSRYSGLYDTGLDRAQEQFAMESKALYKDASTVTVVDGTASYNLPSDFMWEKKMTHKGILLTPISRATMEYYQESDWTDDTGTPKFYIIDPEEGRKTFTLYPIPQGDDAGANLILTYYPLPASSTDDTVNPLNASALMAQFHYGIAAYLAWSLLGNETYTPEISTKRSDLMLTYQKAVTQAVDTFGNTKSASLRLKGGRYWKRDI